MTLAQGDLWQYDDDVSEDDDNWDPPSDADSGDAADGRKKRKGGGVAKGQAHPTKKRAGVLAPLQQHQQQQSEQQARLQQCDDDDSDEVELVCEVGRSVGGAGKATSVAAPRAVPAAGVGAGTQQQQQQQQPAAAAAATSASSGRPPPQHGSKAPPGLPTRNSLSEATREVMQRDLQILERIQKAKEADAGGHSDDVGGCLDAGVYLRSYACLPTVRKPYPSVGLSAQHPQSGGLLASGALAAAARPSCGSAAAAAAAVAPAAPLPAAAPPPAATGTDRIKLRCQWAIKGGKTDSQTLRIVKTDPLSKLVAGFREYAASKGLTTQPQAIKFKFDGDALDPNSTAEDLALEDDDVIDVHLP